MSPVFATYREGRIILDEPVNWPDGSRLAVFPAAAMTGLVESQWPDSEETRAAVVERIDAIQALELTEEDEAEIAASRQVVRQASIEAVRKQMGLPE